MKKILCLALAAVLGLTLAAPTLAWENPFQDVPEDFWAVEYIRQASEDESRLTFVTPAREGRGGFGEPEEVKDWGDTLCTVDLASGTMESMKPFQAG